jgi:hypothetical protein
MVMQGRLEDLQRQLMPHREVIITLLDRVDEAKQILGSVDGIKEVVDLPDEQGKKRLRVDFTGEDTVMTGMVQTLASKGIPVVNFSEQSHDLETVFMRVTKGIVS